MRPWTMLVLCALLLPRLAWARDAETAPPSDRSRDDALLGGSQHPETATTPDSAPAPAPAPPREVAPDNPLTIGGQFYLRAQSSALADQKPGGWSTSSPSLVDAFFDARPNNRVRGFVLGRMQFDPTVSAATPAVPGGFGGIAGTGTMAAGPGPSSTVKSARDAQFALDQLWLRFDIQRTVFVTAGRQHVRWGAARFWAPSDFLHQRQRNPLDPFDARTGTTMLKLHLPWEERGWNFYAYGIGEGGGPTVADLAGAGRAEVVVGTAELGVGAVVQRHRKPKVGVDLSVGVGDFDVYGELAIRYASEIDRVGYDPDAVVAEGTDLGGAVDARYPVYRVSAVKKQAVGGFSYSARYGANDMVTVGGEYFYNSLGYDDRRVYPGLILPHTGSLAEPASYFYLGRHYAALYVTLPFPGSWNLTTFGVSSIANLSDRSVVTRFDYSLVLLTHLRFEAFVALHSGSADGEFRLGMRNVHLGSVTIDRAPAMLDLGVALKVKL
jgi:hypothetical protein